MKLKQASKPIHLWIFAILGFSIFFSACKKDLHVDKVIEMPSKKFEKPLPRVNPFSIVNIQKAQATLTIQQSLNVLTPNRTFENDEDRLYTYLKFDPNSVTGNILKELEADTTIHIMDFPFANGELYNDEFALDEEKAIELADGKLYAVVKKNTTSGVTLINQLNAEVLDELYLPDEEDTTLQFQAFREAGYTEEMIARIRICLFKRPKGFVSYLDQETDRMVNVSGMQVWGLVFGIPIFTHTDGNGYYRFPWRFIGGTIMGTKAKNSRVNIKPFNTQGAWVLSLPIQFIVGSIHIRGWVSACQMRRDINFEFTSHRQNRYWAQIMHSVVLHDQYTESDEITRAPNSLTIYAHWADRNGNSSAPMLGHLSGLNIGSIVLQYIADLLGGATHNDFPNVFNLLTGLLPDITIRTNGTIERQSYSARLMQTAFHELGHGTHFQRAGQAYWLDFIAATLRPNGNCGGYGCGTGTDDGNIGVGESWAEFIGTNYALRNHPMGEKLSAWRGDFLRFDDALEEEFWFFNNWIPTGIYNDLMDINNNDIDEDIWDRTGGLTIKQLYQAFGPKIDEICIYRNEIIGLYPWLGRSEVNEIFERHGYSCF